METWRALECLVDDGQCKSIGLSDISLERLEEIVAAARIKPAVVEVESHPYHPSPMGAPQPLSAARDCVARICGAGAWVGAQLAGKPVITTIAQRAHKTPAQVALASAIQRGTAVLTTSTKPRQIQEGFEVSTLPEEAMEEIRDGITTRVRFNPVTESGMPGFPEFSRMRPSEANAR